MDAAGMSVLRAVRRLGGVARAGELAAAGIGPGLVRTAWNRGEILRVRKGWYADPALPTEAVHAARVGGVLTCVSAARALGLWTPECGDDIHVAVPSTSARLRHPEHHRIRLAETAAPVVVHWTDTAARGVASVEEAIVAAARCQGAEAAFVLMESALHQRRNVGAALARMSRDARRLCVRAGAASESGSESLVKLMLLRMGVPFRQQVRIPGVGRVDFVVGDRLIVEADSKAHHTDQHRDRTRDATASRHGYRSQHYLYAQIVHDPESVDAAIRAAILRGDHR